jgi:hypothetical protein
MSSKPDSRSANTRAKIRAPRVPVSRVELAAPVGVKNPPAPAQRAGVEGRRGKDHVTGGLRTKPLSVVDGGSVMWGLRR